MKGTQTFVAKYVKVYHTFKEQNVCVAVVIWYGDSVVDTIENISSIFSLI